MNTLLSKRRNSLINRWAGVTAIAATLILAACGSDVGSARLKSIPKSAQRDEAVRVMGTGPLAPTTPADEQRIVNGFRHQIYITAGMQFEILWYREAPGTLSDPITKETDTPIVVVGDTVAGWGWKFFTPFAGKYNLPNPTRDRERIDSIARSQIPKKS